LFKDRNVPGMDDGKQPYEEKRYDGDMMQNMMVIAKANICIDVHDTDLTTSDSGQL
jgi:hypothetical protein